MLDKKNYICTKPFKELQLFTTQNYVCCPGWLNTPIGNDGTIKEKTKSLSPEKWCCYFLAILNWGTYGNGEFLLKDVSNPEHIEHKSFIKELHKVSHLPNCLSNMNHLY